MGTTVGLLSALSAVVLARLELLAYSDRAVNRERVLSNVSTDVILVCGRGFVGAADCLNYVELVRELGVLS